jgi:hypothetical protein
LALDVLHYPKIEERVLTGMNMTANSMLAASSF